MRSIFAALGRVNLPDSTTLAGGCHDPRAVGLCASWERTRSPHDGFPRGKAPPLNPTGTTDTGRERLVEGILSRLSEEVGEDRCERYFRHDASLTFADGRLDITVPTGFKADLLRRRFEDPLRRAARAELERSGFVRAEVEVRFNIDGKAFAGRDTAATAPEPARAEPRRGAAPASKWSPKYTLETFIVGASNRLAYSAAVQVSDREMPRRISPLFVHGTSGLGKTHLLQGIAARFLETRPGANVRYIPAETFTNEFITALRASKLDHFRRAYRGVDLLCLDDVHFLSNKQATQTELLHTFDAIDLDGARVVLASDAHPRQIARLSAALISRFLSGMVVRVEAPDAATRRSIIASIARRLGIDLEPAGVELIVRETGEEGSVRELEGLMTRIEAMHRLLPGAGEPGRIGATLIRRALGLVADDRATGRPIRADAVVAHIASTLGVGPEELAGRGRHPRVVLARSLSAHLCRCLTSHSFPEIARALTRPNHSTVVTACRRIREQLERDEPVKGVEGLEGVSLRELVTTLTDGIRRAAAGRA